MLRYAISKGEFALGHQKRRHLLAHAEYVATERVDFFLLREPGVPASELAALAREILPLLEHSQTRLFLHSRPDIAAATNAHGVHLPSSHQALTPAQVRSVFKAANRPAPTVSLSCHTPEDLDRARNLRPDLILFGPVFGKSVHRLEVQPGIGLEALRQACARAAPIPVLALGDVTEARISSCTSAGSAGIAAIRLFAP